MCFSAISILTHMKRKSQVKVAEESGQGKSPDSISTCSLLYWAWSSLMVLSNVVRALLQKGTGQMLKDVQESVFFFAWTASSEKEGKTCFVHYARFRFSGKVWKYFCHFPFWKSREKIFGLLVWKKKVVLQTSSFDIHFHIILFKIDIILLNRVKYSSACIWPGQVIRKC